MQSNGAAHQSEPQRAPEIEDFDFQTDPLAGIVDDFMRRIRAGESVTVDEYLANYPEMTDRLRQLLRMVLGLEQLRSHPIDEGAVTSATFSLLAGQRLGDYLLVREIGRGGMGIVYEALQESLARRVAVKLFHCGVQPNPMLMERFEREARVAAQLHHTNIVPGGTTNGAISGQHTIGVARKQTQGQKRQNVLGTPE